MRSNADPIVPFQELGFVVLPSFLLASERGELRRACDLVLARSRLKYRETAHSTERIELLAEGTSSEHPQDVLSPIARFAGSERVCALLLALARVTRRDAPRLKGVHYYHEQTKRDWEGDWHRDSQFRQPDPALERQRIDTTLAIHVRVALEDDDCLEIVPGSHARWDTPEELRVRKGAERASALMPNATRVRLRAGDGCLFHAWSIHRATYRRAPVRRTVDALYELPPGS